VLIPLCAGDACACDAVDAKAKAKKKLPGDAATSASASSSSASASSSSPSSSSSSSSSSASSSADLQVSDKYIQSPTLCPHCCLKRITAAVSHICTSVSSVTRPATIPIPTGSEELLRDDDDYLSVSHGEDSFLVTRDMNAFVTPHETEEHGTRHTSHVTHPPSPPSHPPPSPRYPTGCPALPLPPTCPPLSPQHSPSRNFRSQNRKCGHRRRGRGGGGGLTASA